MAKTQEFPNRSFGAYGTNRDHPELMPHAAAEACYETLFPIKEERDGYENIRKWLTRAYKKPDADWAELFCTMQEDDQPCAAMAFLSFHRPSKWWFGNYLGILKEARKLRGLPEFFQHVASNCRSIGQDAKGIVFEVEPFQEEYLERVLERVEASLPGPAEPLPNEERFREEKFNIEAARRVQLYTNPYIGYHVLTPADGEGIQAGAHLGGAYVLMSDGTASRRRKPVEYVQPAMQLPLDKSNEVPLWLMIYPFESMHIEMTGNGRVMASDDVENLFDFLYNEVFGFAFAPGGEDSDPNDEDLPALEGYAEYLSGLYQRMRAKLQERQFFLEDQVLSPTVRRLLGLYGPRLKIMYKNVK